MNKPKRRRAHATGPGPIAAWRLSLAVGSAAVTTGMPLTEAMRTGQNMDLALGRSFGVAVVVWVAAGRVNRVFADVQQRSASASEPGGSATTDDGGHVSGANDGVGQPARS